MPQMVSSHLDSHGVHVVVSGMARVEVKGNVIHRGPGTVLLLMRMLLSKSIKEKVVAETNILSFFLKSSLILDMMGQSTEMTEELWHLAGVWHLVDLGPLVHRTLCVCTHTSWTCVVYVVGHVIRFLL